MVSPSAMQRMAGHAFCCHGILLPSLLLARYRVAIFESICPAIRLAGSVFVGQWLKTVALLVLRS
jgi:hypothetical protein